VASILNGASRNSVRRRRAVCLARFTSTRLLSCPERQRMTAVLNSSLAHQLFARSFGSTAAAAQRACKADWERARSTYAHTRQLGDDLLIELFDATNKFFNGAQARDAFRGGWTAEELFGITLEKPRRCGAVCAAVYANVDTIRFDGPWVWINTPPIAEERDGGSLQRRIRTDFRFLRAVPWWRHPSPTLSGPGTITPPT
jgi:hypothetical protein